MKRTTSAFIALLISFLFATQLPAETLYYHADHLGSTVAITNENGMVIKNHQLYLPFGQKISADNAGNDIWYTGKPHDDDTGLTYMNARYYDPTVGLFMAMDPVGPDSAGPLYFNRYAYAANNPYKYNDPGGEVLETAWDAANVAWGAVSFSKNVAIGNYWGAALDGAGLAYDVFASFVPVLPGGAGAGIKALRYGDEAADVAKSVGNVGDFMADNAARLNKKLGKKIGQGRLPFERGREGIEKAKKTITDTLNNSSAISNPFTNSNGDKVFDVFSEKTGFTVRVREGGVFDTLIDAKTNKF